MKRAQLSISFRNCVDAESGTDTMSQVRVGTCACDANVMKAAPAFAIMALLMAVRRTSSARPRMTRHR